MVAAAEATVARDAVDVLDDAPPRVVVLHGPRVCESQALPRFQVVYASRTTTRSLTVS